MATTEHEEGTAQTAGADPAAARSDGRRGRRRGGRIAATVSVVGELLITGGVVLGLFVVYSLWWTNVLADRQAQREGDQVRRQWAQPRSPGKPVNFSSADGIGFLHVPAMGKGYEVLVKKGTSVDVLNQGVAGYYLDPVKSALPWDKSGNFTLAAHRDGHGAKFHNIDKIKDGDAIVFETRDTWYIYKVYDILAQTSKYNTQVIDQIPKESGKNKPGHYITLTTCTPVYTSEYRYIVWGELVRTQQADAQRTLPQELR